jgi:hypothetical protein
MNSIEKVQERFDYWLDFYSEMPARVFLVDFLTFNPMKAIYKSIVEDKKE